MYSEDASIVATRHLSTKNYVICKLIYKRVPIKQFQNPEIKLLTSPGCFSFIFILNNLLAISVISYRATLERFEGS